ncbi:DMT family transporter [Ahrensia sp. R2A130]|uniref:DMT family transporter n=1 Tax=Ahrensia sp. R2A130 TaxID=744979 RepID=UPI0001E0BC2A|nr:DMT family transporter [Ahrensia sp. R2A130]EFL90189.1 transporter [Ahrensia sp. R2A130]
MSDDQNSTPEAIRERRNAYLLLAIMPLFFSSNIIFGRAAVDDVEPFTLAFIRWTSSALILLLITAGAVRAAWPAIRSAGSLLFINAFLGMWICGALVYLALKYTSATNGTLIYTSSPVLIILTEWLFRGRAVGWREIVGITAALIGVVVIVAKGSFAVLAALKFNAGDLIFVLAAISWAIYSVVLKSKAFDGIPTLPLFTVTAACGGVLLAPFAVAETVWLSTFPNTWSSWGNIAGIVFISSLLAFSAFQYGVKVLGPSVAGISLYLLPVYGVTLAVIWLGEELATYHGWGIALVLSGVIFATLPKRLAKA